MSERQKPGVTIHEPSAYTGYTLYNSRQLEEAKLIDMQGNVVHRWTYPQGFSWHYAALTGDGTLGVVIKEVEKEVPGMFLELDWDGELVQQFDVPAHHDFERLDNGNTIILCREYVDEVPVYDGATAQSDYYVEMSPDGEPVWEWHAHEHARELEELLGLEFPKGHRDWAHTNTVETIPEAGLTDDSLFEAGDILFSMRAIDTIGVIRKNTGEIIWAWGPGKLQGQHIPVMLDDGRILVFDNGESGIDIKNSREYSRVLEVDPRTDEVVWEYVAEPPSKFYSSSRGSSQRLPNGNTLVTDSNTGRLFEITREGECVWEWKNPDLDDRGNRMPIYRAKRYPPDKVEPRM